jgi:hypothetical protein
VAGAFDIPVYRLAPSDGAVAPHVPGEILFAAGHTHPALTARYSAGARITTRSSDGGATTSAADPLFLIRSEGTLVPVTSSRPPDPQPGDTLVLLGASGEEAPR